VNANNLILVIDDEVEIRVLLTRFLTKKGFDVVSAGSIGEGRTELNRKRPFLIFLDVNLPDGNGLKELKKINSEKIPYQVVMMSAFDDQEVRSEALNSGAIDFLSKPFNIAQLNNLVKNQLKS
jgi:DNA-binding response OmpR family regulator